MSNFSQIWLDLLRDIFQSGEYVSPRGKLTRELLQKTIRVDMNQPVLTVPQRKLSYQFMAAEAYWILTGDDRVETIAPYNSRIAEFSDDGKKFFGAYGPKVVNQIPYVINKLKADPTSRQAGLTIWRESPPETRDYPCTVAMFFSIRNQKLNAHVFMRSSDAWLGIPYDVFNFSMIAHVICAELNESRHDKGFCCPGTLYLTMASSHLYLEHFESAESLLTYKHEIIQQPTPSALWHYSNSCVAWLGELKDSKPGSRYRWWELNHAT